jgi:hypothetical protein
MLLPGNDGNQTADLIPVVLGRDCFVEIIAHLRRLQMLDVLRQPNGIGSVLTG